MWLQIKARLDSLKDRIGEIYEWTTDSGRRFFLLLFLVVLTVATVIQLHRDGYWTIFIGRGASVKASFKPEESKEKDGKTPEKAAGEAADTMESTIQKIKDLIGKSDFDKKGEYSQEFTKLYRAIDVCTAKDLEILSEVKKLQDILNKHKDLISKAFNDTRKSLAEKLEDARDDIRENDRRLKEQ